jgi:hypothetical protein
MASVRGKSALERHELKYVPLIEVTCIHCAYHVCKVDFILFFYWYGVGVKVGRHGFFISLGTASPT